jgi:bacillithiol biosynthesis cysteine-adding enzyme BshC
MSVAAVTKLELRVGPPAGPPLVADLLAGRPALAPFFAGHPADPAAFQRRADEVADRLRRERRTAVAAAIRPLGEAAAGRLAAVLEGEGVFVTTGQQAGLFGGPLYTVHKIVSAIALARALGPILGRPALALFWVAADDHDWDEVSRTDVLDSANRPVRLELTRADAAPVSMAERRLDASVKGVVEALLALLPDTEFRPWIEEAVRQSYRPGASVASAFADLIAAVFADQELALVDPAHEAFKRAAAPVLRIELERTVEHGMLLARTTAALEAGGWHAQVPIAEGAANVFLHDALGRDRLVREGTHWTLRRTRRRLADGEVLALLEREPARFSPNVLLRPVVESAVLPTVAYVGGPAEISYFAQVGCLFRAHGVAPPLAVPRRSVTFVEGKVRKVLDKFGLEPADFDQPFHALAARVLADDMPPAVSASVDALRASITAGYARLADAAVGIDPTLVGWIEGQRNTALIAVDAAARKIASHHRRRHEIEMEQLRKAAANLRPDGAPQERALNALPFLARYGPDLLRDLVEAVRYVVDRPHPAWLGVECPEP